MPRLDPLDLYDIRDQLSDDERMVQDATARFVDEQVLPIISDAFETSTFPRQLVPKMAELGLLGSYLTDYGCAGLNGVSYGLICQELERGDSALRSFVSVQTSLVMWPIFTYGTEEQKKRWLHSLASGESIGCFGLTEPHGGSDPSNMKTVAKNKGGDWILSGAKMWITNGSIADLAIVWARTESGDIKGFLVEKGMPGFEASEVKHKMSLRASITSALYLDEVRVPRENVLPGVSTLKGPLSCLTQARYGIAWGAIGAAQACLKEVLAYSSERELFGRTLNQTQTAQRRMANMCRQITTGQLLALRLGRLKDAGNLSPTQVSLAKWNNVRMALDIARDARDLLGGSGITVEHCPIRHALNLESVITYEGTETVHELAVGREITGVSAF